MKRFKVLFVFMLILLSLTACTSNKDLGGIRGENRRTQDSSLIKMAVIL